MPFTIRCNNKGCGKEQEPYLDVASMEVHCAECGKIMPDVTIFAKNQMKAMGQVKRLNRTQKAFPVECQTCTKMEQPILINGKLSCSFCKSEHTHLPAPYAYAIKQYLKDHKNSLADKK